MSELAKGLSLLLAVVLPVLVGTCVGDGHRPRALELERTRLEPAGPPGPKSVLVIWLDDVGAADLALYGGPISMPNLEALAGQGVTLDRCYANANCSPSRKSLVTGRWWIRGAGAACGAPGPDTPDPLEFWLPEVLGGWSSAMVGKWHLGASPSGQGWECAPLEHGFNYSRELLPENVGACGGEGYFSWTGSELCAPAGERTAYQPHAVRDALVQGWGAAPFPRLAVVSANLAHAPVHTVPPPHTPSSSNMQRARWEAMVRAYDDLLADLVGAVDLRHTVVVVVGDNGTYGAVAPDPTKAKGTVFERGVHVPCVVAGAGIVAKGRRSSVLAHVADLWPTLIVHAGGQLPGGYAVDGVSLVPTLLNEAQTAHETLLVGANWGAPAGERGAVTLTRKLRQVDDDGDGLVDHEDLYDLEADPLEDVDVSGELEYLDDLVALRAFIVAETPP